MHPSISALTLALVCLVAGVVMAGERPRPLVIGHRGACGYVPEHTLASYALAIEQGADFVEPDVVATKDGALICRHDCDLGLTTDAPQKYPERKRRITIDGVESEGWFAEDFTLEEIKTLRARQSMDFRPHDQDGQHEVPTLEEMIHFVQEQSRAAGRSVGIIPETKHPTHHRQLGIPLEPKLLAMLKQFGYTDRDDPCIIQSFEIGNLKELSKQTGLRLIQLMEEPHKQPGDVIAAGGTLTYGQMMTPAGLREIATYAQLIGPWKDTILPQDNRKLGKPTSLVADAHKAGLKVIIYTLRDEPRFLAADYAGDPTAELDRWFQIGVDGLFTDFPDTAVKARQQFRPGGQ